MAIHPMALYIHILSQNHFQNQFRNTYCIFYFIYVAILTELKCKLTSLLNFLDQCLVVPLRCFTTNNLRFGKFCFD